MSKLRDDEALFVELHGLRGIFGPYVSAKRIKLALDAVERHLARRSTCLACTGASILPGEHCALCGRTASIEQDRPPEAAPIEMGEWCHFCGGWSESDDEGSCTSCGDDNVVERQFRRVPVEAAATWTEAEIARAKALADGYKDVLPDPEIASDTGEHMARRSLKNKEAGR